MKTVFCFSIFILTVIVACNKNSESVMNSGYNDKKIAYRTNYDNWVRIDGLVYPAGTTKDSTAPYSARVTLPEGYYFIYQNESDGSLSYNDKKCYRCNCTNGQQSGCNPIYEHSGYDCDRENNCNACKGEEYDCIGGTPANWDKDLLAIINENEDFHFLESQEEFDSLSDIHCGISVIDSIGNLNL